MRLPRPHTYCAIAGILTVCSANIAWMPQASAQRVNPLQITIPSLPDDMAEVDVVDNDLAVRLLDAQVGQGNDMEPTSQPVYLTKSTLAEPPSGNVVIGRRAAPDVPAVPMARVVPKPAPQKRVTERQIAAAPVPVVITPPAVESVAMAMDAAPPAGQPGDAQAFGFHGVAHQKSFLNHFTSVPMSQVNAQVVVAPDTQGTENMDVEHTASYQALKQLMDAQFAKATSLVGEADGQSLAVASASPSPSPAPVGVEHTSLADSTAELSSQLASMDVKAPTANIAPENVPTTAGGGFEMASADTLATMAPAAGVADDVPTVPLSNESKRVLERVPSDIDSLISANGKPISIERESKGLVSYASLQGSTVEAEHDSFGMKIEIRRPKFDVQQELMQAYEAVVGGYNDYALQGYERVLAVSPNNLNALYGKAALLHQMGNIGEAKHYYAKVLKQDPDHREALNNFLSIVADESPDEALTELLRLQRKNPHFSLIPAQISYVFQKMGDYPRAITAMLDAYSLAPENLTYAHNIAVLFDRYGAKQEASPYYQQLVDAHMRGTQTPGNIEEIQERLTFIRSNR